VILTTEGDDSPGYQAECDDGHGYWYWRPVGGAFDAQLAATRANLALHDREVHDKEGITT
jgi:hypothetical protein